MADLFDIKTGGAGWHVTSHLIALVALFVACFAITGYITFRDDSIPPKALETDQSADDNLKVNNIEANGTLSVAGNTTLGGSNLVINSVTGFTTTEFKTHTAADVSNFMTARNQTDAAGIAIKIPAGAFILQARVTVLTGCADGTDYDIGLNTTTATTSANIFDALPLASVNATTDVVFGANARAAIGTLAQTAASFVTITTNTTDNTQGELQIDILYAL